jgi:hypothetical protein
VAIAEELLIVVDAKVSQAVKDMKKVDRSMDGTSKTAGKLKDAFKAMAGPVALGAVIAGVIKLGKEAEDAFQAQEKAVVGVNAALKATGQFTEEAAQDMQDYASALQEITTVGDEVTLSMIQTAINMGLTADQAKEATKQAIGMSEAYGVGLDTALRGTANATLGNFDALTRYLPAIKTATTEAEKAAIVNEQLGDAFEIATANAKTSAGVQAQLSNSYGDLLETVGSVISEALTPYRENLKKEVESVNQSIKAHLLRKKALEGNATLLEEFTLKQIEQEKTVEALAQAEANLAAAENQKLDQYIKDEALLLRLEAAKQEGIKTAQNTISDLQDELTLRRVGTEAARKALEEENKLIDANIRLTQGMNEVTTATGEKTGAIDEDTEAMNENLLVLDANEQLNQLLIASHRAINEEIWRTPEAVQAVTDAVEEQKVSWEDLAEVGLGSVTSGMADIGKSLVDGTLGIKNFGKLFLNMISETLNALGAQLTALATVQLLLGNFAGAAAGYAQSGLAFLASGVVAGAAGSFENGGVVPGTSYSGDNMVARVNSGEVVLNQEQQANLLMDKANGAGGGGTYILSIDGEQFNAFIQQKIDNRSLVSSAGGAI